MEEVTGGPSLWPAVDLPSRRVLGGGWDRGLSVGSKRVNGSDYSGGVGSGPGPGQGSQRDGESRVH